jgi:hypothetical protein
MAASFLGEPAESLAAFAFQVPLPVASLQLPVAEPRTATRLLATGNWQLLLATLLAWIMLGACVGLSLRLMSMGLTLCW